ncbi:MAG TPA: caspase family protein [Kofleriaceae bacterium]|nr:caspase family protein [Kofleriaceae bacterium]
MTRGLVLVGCAIACVVAAARTAGSARADVERYAVIVGHNTGAADEQRLRFAEDDAERVGELLGEVGGVPDENQVVLRGKSADQVRRALIATNERIRVGQRAGRQAMLFVYYSGHGDADALHLGDSRLELRELEALVRGSAAQIRVLAVDACRSGSVTRVKGGRPAPPIALRGDDELPGEGVIVLTASTAGEDAQESDDLRGSFFTHYLLSALRGAADDDGDQLITIGEAFRYTREQTILASSRTLGGVQHPTFHYDLRGRADVVLVDLGSDKGRGLLTVPADASWLVVREGGGARDTIVGEIGADATRRTLSLRPGRYKVRGRSRDALLEGSAIVARGQETVVASDTLTRTTYARLVRKGRGEILHGVTGIFAGPAIQSAIIEGASPCLGGAGGITWVRSDVTLSPRASLCRGDFANETLTATTTALALDVRVAKAWDVHRVTLDVGVTVGGELLRETFTTRGEAPPRTSGALHIDAGLGTLVPFTARFFLTSEIAAQTHLFTLEDRSGARDLAARFAVRGVLAIGAWL